MRTCTVTTGSSLLLSLERIECRWHGHRLQSHQRINKNKLDHQNLNEVLPFNPTARIWPAGYATSYLIVIKLKLKNQNQTLRSMRKINQIFYSLQGEGFYTGRAAVFIRFSGCNLKCSFCDTEHEEGTLMSDEEILEQSPLIRQTWSYWPVGNLLYGSTKHLSTCFTKAGKYICIETNGTRPLPKGIDWVTCSPKEGAPLKIDHMDEVKIVYLGQDLSSYIKLPAKYHFLQPCSCRNTMEIVNYILQHPEWQLSLQTQ